MKLSLKVLNSVLISMVNASFRCLDRGWSEMATENLIRVRLKGKSLKLNKFLTAIALMI